MQTLFGKLAALSICLGCGAVSRGGAGSATAGEGAAAGLPLAAIQCRVYTRRVGDRHAPTDDATRTVTVTAGQTRTTAVRGGVLSAAMSKDGFMLMVRSGDAELYRAIFPIDGAPPSNRFGDAGFTGRIYLADPAQHADHQLSCAAVPRTEAHDKASERAARRDAELQARRQALLQALQARQACTLTDAQRQAGAQCASQYSVTVRVAAMLALHREQLRDFRGVSMVGAQLEGADLRESQMPNADFTGASLRGASLYFNDLRNAILRDAKLEHANLWAANLERADLRRADLQGAKLQHADLEGANLAGANLRDAYLMGTDLDGADLSGADLGGAVLEGASLRGTRLDAALLEGVRNVTQLQLEPAFGNAETRLPAGFVLRRDPAR